jgi:hypothetical protein
MMSIESTCGLGTVRFTDDRRQSRAKDGPSSLGVHFQGSAKLCQSLAHSGEADPACKTGREPLENILGYSLAIVSNHQDSFSACARNLYIDRACVCMAMNVCQGLLKHPKKSQFYFLWQALNDFPHLQPYFYAASF